MIRATLLSAPIGLAVACGAFASRIAGISWESAVGVACATWLIFWGLGAATFEAIRRARLSSEHRQGRGRLGRGMAAAAAVDRVSRGLEGSTLAHGGLLALERAVLLLPARDAVRGDARERLEAAVRSDISRSSRWARMQVVAGLRDAADAATAALDAPLHPLHRPAPRLLAELGVDGSAGRWLPPGTRRCRTEWARRRGALDPARAEEGIAVRLLAAGLERAALAALAHAPATERAARLRRLARCRSLLRDAARGSFFAPPPSTVVQWRVELLLLAGRRLPDLAPGSALLRRVEGGAASLERIVARTSLMVAELVSLLDECPELERPVATVVARVVGWPVGAVVSAIRGGTLVARPDEALRSHLRGLALLEERRLLEAGAEFEAALVLAPDFAQAAFALATTKRRLGNVAAGEVVLRSLVERRPREPEPALLLARFLSAAGERERAHAAYAAAVEQFPDCVPLRVAFAQELIAWGSPGEAVVQLAAAREDAPDEPRLALLAGRTMAVELRLVEAAHALELAARGLHGAERAEAWFWLMNVRRDQGDHTTAQRIARRLVHVLGRGQSSFLDDVAEYLEERQDYVRAREASERARRWREHGG